jgi:uncharacterized protein YodC (DUF2158 family)
MVDELPENPSRLKNPPDDSRCSRRIGMNLQVGFLVKLKSGGPKMTVVDVSRDDNGPFTGKVQCQWFQYNDTGHEALEWEWFPPGCLVLLPGDDQIG